MKPAALAADNDKASEALSLSNDDRSFFMFIMAAVISLKPASLAADNDIASAALSLSNDDGSSEDIIPPHEDKVGL